MPLDTDIYKKNNLIDKLKIDIKTEITKIEENLKTLKSFQAVIDPPQQKRKYKKRKKVISADSAPRNILQAANTKKKPGRSRKDPVAA